MILASGLAGLASADRLTLRNGSVIEGTYLGGTAREIRMDVSSSSNGGLQTFRVEQVLSVSFSDDSYHPAPPPPPPPPARSPQANDSYSSRGGFNRAENSDQPRNYPSSAGTLGITIPADTTFTIRMIDPVDSQTARRGQTFRASIDEPVVVDGRQIIPRGADVTAKLVDDQQSGKLQGRTSLTLALVNVSVDGRLVDITSTDVRTASSSRGARTAGVVGGGAAVGAIIGAIAGGGKGAAIGAASGGALGGATEVFTNGQQVKIPSETRLTFRLQSPVQI